MARTPKPWFDNERKVWKVTIGGRRYNLGKDKKLAMEKFHRLMAQTLQKKVLTHSLAGIIDSFLEWVHKHRSPDTYEWYRYRLQRFIDCHRELRIQDLRPFHVENWVDSYEGLSRTSRRNYIRSVKRCFIWATKQGYLDANPVENLEAPSAERREVVISSEEYDAILRYTPDESLRDLITTTWLTGCRPQPVVHGEELSEAAIEVGRSRMTPSIRHGLAATQSRKTMALDASPDEIGAVVVRHNIESRIVEAWNIFAVYTIRGKS